MCYNATQLGLTLCLGIKGVSVISAVSQLCGVLVRGHQPQALRQDEIGTVSITGDYNKNWLECKPVRARQCLQK